MAEYEAKRKKMLDEYNHQISYRVDQLPITKISYKVNSSKEASMRITRGNNPLNLTVYEKFRLQTLRFSEWLEVHALSFQSKGKFLALGWLLEEIHVTWAHLVKKRTRLQLYTKSLKKLCIQSVETASRVSSDVVRTFEVTESEIRETRVYKKDIIGSPDYKDANLEQELESIECRVESLMRNEVLLYYEGGFTLSKRPYQEEFEGRILKLIDDKENQIRQLEEDMRKTKDTFMCLVDSLIATLKVKIEAQRAHSIKTKKIDTFPTHTPTVTLKILKPIMVHRVSMISNIKPTIYRTPHQYLNSNLKMPILHSFEENKLKYEDEDEVEIKMMGTRMDKESLEHNFYENDITPIICHNFSPTSNPPIKPKDSGSFRMKEILQEITNGNLRAGIFEEKKKNYSLQTLKTASGLILTASPGLLQENSIFN
ncbi:hypothetical protein Tco_0908985 [Tanacetum coccineum]|uniref:Uncharacterized protein n=1 Tax=Tanacetum coccineum TaxID=301880 RepID=A0ABQ5CNP5_9ASTR